MKSQNVIIIGSGVAGLATFIFKKGWNGKYDL